MTHNPLAAYLDAHEVTHDAFAALVGRDRSTVTRWASKGPRTLEAAVLIERASKGAVPAAVWAAAMLCDRATTP